MKKIIYPLFLLLITFSMSIQAQDEKEYEDRIIRLEHQVLNMEKDLQSFNKQFRTGTRLFFGGIGASAFGYLNLVLTDGNTTGAVVVIALGGVLSMVGYIIQLDAHKYLGGKNSLSVRGKGLNVSRKGLGVEYRF